MEQQFSGQRTSAPRAGFRFQRVLTFGAVLRQPRPAVAGGPTPPQDDVAGQVHEALRVERRDE